MNKMIHRYFVVLFILVCVFLASCSGSEELSYSKETEEISEYAWREKNFKDMTIKEEKLLYLTEFEKLTGENVPKTDYANVVGEADSFYRLSHYEDEPNRYFYELSSQMGISDAKDIFTFDVQKDLGINQPYVVDYHIYSDSTSVFYVYDEEDKSVINGPLAHYYIVFLDKYGNFEKKIDILPALAENGIFKSYNHRCNYLSQDKDGYHYFWDNNKGVILVLDNEGNTVFCEKFNDYQSGEAIECIKTNEDEIIFVRTQRKGARFILPDIQKSAFVPLFELKLDRLVQKWHSLWGNKIYFSQEDKLKAWNIETGEVTTILDEGEFSLRYFSLEFIPVPDGVDIFYHEGTKQSYYAFRKEESEKEFSITIANFCQNDLFLRKCRNIFHLENLNIEIDYEDCHADTAKTDRMMMDIMNGNGPDIMYVPRENMEDLAKYNALADLSELISDDNLEVIYPTVLNAGEVEGKLIALPLSASIETVLVTDRYVSDSSWTTEEVIKIINEYDEELDGIFLKGNMQSYKTNLKMLLGDNLLDSEFIHDGKAFFENELFIELLRTIKRKTNEDKRIDLNDIYKLLKEGKYLGMHSFVGTFSKYCNDYCQIGSSMHSIGKPGDNGRKVPMEIDGYIVVNHIAFDKVEVARFVDYLFSFDAQCMVQVSDEEGYIGASVRNDMLVRNVGEFNGDYVLYNRSSGFLSYKYLMPTSAGELPLEEYESLWNDAIYQNSAQETIMEMIVEEADEYFYLDKDLNEVVKNINKRVQLYLNENDL